jgi:hypothetical protein
MIRLGLLISKNILFVLLAITFILQLSGCNSKTEPTILPQINASSKANPKLDSKLDQLVISERSGNATSFARQNNIELLGSSVRVIIEVTPEQIETASQAVNDAGGKIETSSGDLMQAIIPIIELTKVADSSAIQLIRLPMLASPNS